MSAMLSSIMETTIFVECFDMAILVSFMGLGWFAWSFLCRLAAQKHWQQHLRAKVASADGDAIDVFGDILARGPDSAAGLGACTDDAQMVRYLLESHGVFAAPPGAWVSAAGMELDATSESSEEADGEWEGTESDSDWEAAQDSGAFQAVASCTSNIGMLFEHYSLFQSEPGTWCPAQGECIDNEADYDSLDDLVLQ